MTVSNLTIPSHAVSTIDLLIFRGALGSYGGALKVDDLPGVSLPTIVVCALNAP